MGSVDAAHAVDGDLLDEQLFVQFNSRTGSCRANLVDVGLADRVGGIAHTMSLPNPV